MYLGGSFLFLLFLGGELFVIENFVRFSFLSVSIFLFWIGIVDVRGVFIFRVV